MAQYEDSVGNVLTNLSDSGLSPSTLDAISGLLGSDPVAPVGMEDYSGTPAGEGVQILTVGAYQQLTGNPGDAPVIIMDADSPGADVQLDASPGGRVFIAGGGADNIQFQGDGDVTVETGGGNDSVQTGDGDDEIVITGEGSVTVDSGMGDDVIILTGEGGQATIDGGDGFDRVGLDDSRGNHEFTLVDGILTLNSSPTQLENVEVVQFEDGISVLAENSTTAGVGRLYEVLFDREADLGGLKYWTDSADDGASLTDITNGFIGSQEFNNEYASDSNEVFLEKLYQGMAGRAADAGGLAYWLGQMDNGLSQADVAQSFAQSEEAIQLMGIDGTQYVIDLSGQE